MILRRQQEVPAYCKAHQSSTTIVWTTHVGTDRNTGTFNQPNAGTHKYTKVNACSYHHRHHALSLTRRFHVPLGFWPVAAYSHLLRQSVPYLNVCYRVDATVAKCYRVGRQRDGNAVSIRPSIHPYLKKMNDILHLRFPPSSQLNLLGSIFPLLSQSNLF